LTTGNPYCSATIFGDFQTNSLECFCATHGFKEEVDIAAVGKGIYLKISSIKSN
jgi:hypothetical protein